MRRRPTRLTLSVGLAHGAGVPARHSDSDGEPERSRHDRCAPPVHHRRWCTGSFYREAGPLDGWPLVLLHGFPTSSFMYRELIPRLADRFHVIAPDQLGFGLSDAPPAGDFAYSFDELS